MNHVEIIAVGPPLGTAGVPVRIEWTVTGEEPVGGEYEVNPRGWVLPEPPRTHPETS